MSIVFQQFKRNLIRIFSGYNLLWHIIAILLTFLIVTTGFDWVYYGATRSPILRSLVIPAITLGGLLPILVPIIVYVVGLVRKNAHLKTIAGTLGQAAIFGTLISGAYKAFTGRAHPSGFFTDPMTTDITKIFHFGFWRGGVFWGWPSTHTTLAFATAISLTYLFPKNKLVKVLCWVWAFYVGFGVSVSIHWFSDFIAGAIIGTVIGVVVGKSYSQSI